MSAPATWEPGRRLLTVPEAAVSVERSPGTIRRWLAAGWLRPTATWAGLPLLLEADVLEVDAQLARPRPRPAPRPTRLSGVDA